MLVLESSVEHHNHSAQKQEKQSQDNCTMQHYNCSESLSSIPRAAFLRNRSTGSHLDRTGKTKSSNSLSSYGKQVTYFIVSLSPRQSEVLNLQTWTMSDTLLVLTITPSALLFTLNCDLVTVFVWLTVFENVDAP